MKRFLFWLAGSVILAVALLFLTGVFLPRDHRARSCITLDQPAESLWTVMRDIGATPGWWPGLERAERTGDGSQERWAEVADGFSMTVRVEEVTPGTEFRTVIESEPGAVFGGQWIYEVGARTAAGHPVCVTEEGWVANPLFRTISAAMGQHGSLDSYLTALARRFGSDTRPEHRD